MGKEALKLLLALGTGVFTAVVAAVSDWVPDSTDPISYGIITIVVAAIKRGLDWLGTKINTAPTPTDSLRR